MFAATRIVAGLETTKQLPLGLFAAGIGATAALMAAGRVMESRLEAADDPPHENPTKPPAFPEKPTMAFFHPFANRFLTVGSCHQRGQSSR